MKALIQIVIGIVLLQGCAGEGKKPTAGDSEKFDLKIAYNVLVDEEKDDYDVFTVELDGSRATNITKDGDVAWCYLTGSNTIYFISDRDTCSRCFYLYAMDPDGSHIRKITTFRLRDSWMSSRNGDTELVVNPHPSVDSVFYIIDTAGTVLRKVDHGLAYGNDPCFSPDGSRIVFRGAEKRSKREKGFVDELYMIHVDGSGLKQLTQYPASDTSAPWYAYKAGPPRWNAAEDFITYQSLQNGKYSLYAITPDGLQQWKLTNIQYNEGWHDWSPDGKLLSIELFDDQQTWFRIGLMNWDTRELKMITDTLYAYQQAPSFVVIPR